MINLKGAPTPSESMTRVFVQYEIQQCVMEDSKDVRKRWFEVLDTHTSFTYFPKTPFICPLTAETN